MPKIDHTHSQLQSFVNHLGDGALILHAGRIVLANDAFFQVTGLEPDQINGKPLADLVVLKDQDRVTHFFADDFSIENSGQIEFSIARTEKDIPVKMAVTPLEHSADQRLLAILSKNADREKDNTGLVHEVQMHVGEMFHTLNTQLMHIINAKDGIVEDLETLRALVREAEISQSKLWVDTQSSLNTYCHGLQQACRKITDTTRTFNSLFSSVIKKHADD